MENIKKQNPTVQNLLTSTIIDCEMALDDSWDRSDEGFKAMVKNLVKSRRLDAKKDQTIENLRTKEKQLKDIIRQLGKAISNGDPEDIATLWVFHARPLLKK